MHKALLIAEGYAFGTRLYFLRKRPFFPKRVYLQKGVSGCSCKSGCAYPRVCEAVPANGDVSPLRRQVSPGKKAEKDALHSLKKWRAS